MIRLKDTAKDLGAGLAAACLTLWIVGIALGMGYWALKGWPLGVALSWVVPWFGVISTLADLYQ